MDNTTAILFLLGLAIPFGWDAVSEQGWRRYGAGALSAVFFLAALAWVPFNGMVPVIAAAISAAAAQPSSWVALLLFAAAVMIFTRPTFRKPPEGDHLIQKENGSSIEQALTRIDSQMTQLGQNAYGLQTEVAEIVPVVRAIARERFLADLSASFEGESQRLEKALSTIADEYKKIPRLPIGSSVWLGSVTTRQSSIEKMNHITQAAFGAPFNPAEQNGYFADAVHGDEDIQDADVKQKYRQAVAQLKDARNLIEHTMWQFQNQKHAVTQIIHQAQRRQ